MATKNDTRSVCVVGAGPAGLVAAKSFLQKGGYTVTVYEGADRVGGMWRAQPGEKGDKCDPEMRTNLSRFTVAFSDLSWASVDLSAPDTTAPSASVPPVFPKAWQVGRYLTKYAEKFGINAHIFFNKKVVRADLQDDRTSWSIMCLDLLTNEHSFQTFDYLVCASGFFDQPMSRDFFDNPHNSFDPYLGLEDEHPGHFQHSSQFRALSELTDKPGKIAVIGGGISGAEAAAQAAMQISNAKFSPGSTGLHADSIVYHITNRPFYSLPRFLPQDPISASSSDTNPAPHFLPLDLVLFNLTRRGPGQISAALTTVPPANAINGHRFIRSLIGNDQSNLGSSTLVYDNDQLQYPAYTGISDTYAEFVRSGTIVPVQGFVNGVSERYEDYEGFQMELLPKAPWKVVDCSHGTPRELFSASAIIEATGYSSSIEYLRSSFSTSVGYDEACPRIPLILSRGSVFTKHIPTLGFVGFYEGPYWGVMEQQARLLVDTWTREALTASPTRAGQIFQFDDAENMRAAIKAKSLQVPQFWQADYVGLVEEIARHTRVTRNDNRFGDGIGPVFPARYCGKSGDSEAASVVNEVSELFEASQNRAKFVAAAVFRGMQGIWSISRRINSRMTSMPGGTLEGTAHFHPRFPTDAMFTAEYIYIEEGKLVLDNGPSFSVTRRYIYRYNEAADEISAWFAEEDGKSVGRLFNTWQFEEPSSENMGWVARGHHWCDPDTYKNTCVFRFKGATLEDFNIVYEVEGPNKDYSHDSKYARPAGA